MDEALVAGSLHQVGKLVLAANLPEEFQRIGKSAAPTPLEAKREVFGTTHAEAGGYLLGLWGLPAAVVEAITPHQAPVETQKPKFSALTAVHAADALIAENAPGGATTFLDLNYITHLGLANRVPAWRDAARELNASPQT